MLAPVLIGATRAFDDALGAAAVDGWAWLVLVTCLAVVLTLVGTLAYRVLVDN